MCTAPSAAITVVGKAPPALPAAPLLAPPELAGELAGELPHPAAAVVRTATIVSSGSRRVSARMVIHPPGSWRTKGVRYEAREASERAVLPPRTDRRLWARRPGLSSPGGITVAGQRRIRTGFAVLSVIPDLPGTLGSLPQASLRSIACRGGRGDRPVPGAGPSSRWNPNPSPRSSSWP